jgi:hypothetical protein
MTLKGAKSADVQILWRKGYVIHPLKAIYVGRRLGLPATKDHLFGALPQDSHLLGGHPLVTDPWEACRPTGRHCHLLERSSCRLLLNFRHCLPSLQEEVGEELGLLLPPQAVHSIAASCAFGLCPLRGHGIEPPTALHLLLPALASQEAEDFSHT